MAAGASPDGSFARLRMTVGTFFGRSTQAGSGLLSCLRMTGFEGLVGLKTLPKPFYSDPGYNFISTALATAVLWSA
jgi:hypothetical protein